MGAFTRYDGTDLFLPSTSGSGPRTGYLAPEGASLPDTLTLSDALTDGPGQFILFPDLPADPTDFIRQAQVYLANPARAGALIAWFSNPDQALQGLAAWVLIAPRPAGQPTTVTVTRLAQLQFANLTLSLTPDTVVSVGQDGDSLDFTAGGAANTLAATPFGQSKPVLLPLAGTVSLALVSAGPANGCFSFGLTLDQTAAVALDMGLRMFTAPPGGGYAATTRYPLLELTPTAEGAPPTASLAVTLDPLAPLDEARSVFAFSDVGAPLPSTYRTPAGGALTLAPEAGAGLVFSPRLSAVDAAWQPIVTPGRTVLYMIPKGGFTLAAAAGAPHGERSVAGAPPDLSGNLMCGLSGVEYLSGADGASLQFVTGANAFAGTLKMATTDSARVFGPLINAAQTAWAYLSAPSGSTYYAQPDSAVTHRPDTAAPGSPLLQYAQLAAGTLPPALASAAAAAGAFPLLPYAAAEAGPGLTPGDLVQFETQVTAPARRRLMPAYQAAPAGRAVELAEAAAAVTTPQGLLLTLQGTAWSQLLLAVSPSEPPADRSRNLLLDGVSGALRDALQSNQLFLVVTSAGALMGDAQIPYALTAARLDILAKTAQLDPAVIQALQPLKDRSWPDQTSFDTALQAQLTPAQYTANHQTILAYTGDFSLFVADWEFDLSPWRWGDHNSILIFKFCNKRLDQLVADTSQWVHAEDFNTSPAAAQQQISSILQDAGDRLAAGDTDLAYFVNTVMHDPQWNGVLVLNAEVPLAGLPPQLEGLAAGIDASQFQAHHVGINVTPVQPGDGGLAAMPSAVFGLIDYEDPSDLSGTALAYQFKVNQLKVLIANSEIVGFSSRIELMINALFGEPVQQLGAPDNCLHLNGYYQQSGGVGSYSFVTSAATAYGVSSQVLAQVGIQQARFVTLTSTDPDNTTISSRFNLSGAIDFAAQPGFDLFSYGAEQQPPPASAATPGLTYANLSIDMSFDVATPTYRTFAFDAQHILLDAATSQARADSLASHFPMKLTGLYQASGSATPDSLGYMPVDSPLQGSQLTAPWFALQYDLDLGTPGALAAQVGFTAGLLLAWSPDPAAASLYVGLRLPGVSGGQRAISLQGVLSLDFGRVSFLVQPPTYILELSNIVLKFLSLSFPPGGQTSLVLFGNPNAQTSGALGWYASYVKTGAGQGGGGKTRLASRSAAALAAPAFPETAPPEGPCA